MVSSNVRSVPDASLYPTDVLPSGQRKTADLFIDSPFHHFPDIFIKIGIVEYPLVGTVFRPLHHRLSAIESTVLDIRGDYLLPRHLPTVDKTASSSQNIRRRKERHLLRCPDTELSIGKGTAINQDGTPIGYRRQLMIYDKQFQIKLLLHFIG